ATAAVGLAPLPSHVARVLEHLPSRGLELVERDLAVAVGVHLLERLRGALLTHHGALLRVELAIMIGVVLGEDLRLLLRQLRVVAMAVRGRDTDGANEQRTSDCERQFELGQHGNDLLWSCPCPIASGVPRLTTRCRDQTPTWAAESADPGCYSRSGWAKR